MLYTSTRSIYQGDRIQLFPTPDAVRAAAGDGRPVFGVAVGFDFLGRCVFPLWTSPQVVDPAWTAPAEAYPDGSVLVQGPIPRVLFAE